MKEALNVDTFQGMVRLVKSVLLLTLCFEGAGAVLSFLSFIHDYPPLRALWISVFHSIAAFNNSGFDILGGLRNLIPYQTDFLLNLTTCGLIIFGGIGFLVMLDMGAQPFLLPEDDAAHQGGSHHHCGPPDHRDAAAEGNGGHELAGGLFHSVSARTGRLFHLPHRGSYQCRPFYADGSNVYRRLPRIHRRRHQDHHLFLPDAGGPLRFHQAAPRRFHRTLPTETLSKASVIALLSLLVVFCGTFFLCVLEPSCTFLQLLFEVVSAFGTVGLSTGITPDLCVASKLIIIFTMFIGRLGAFTLLSIWINRPESGAHYTEESITIG